MTREELVALKIEDCLKTIIINTLTVELVGYGTEYMHYIDKTIDGTWYEKIKIMDKMLEVEYPDLKPAQAVFEKYFEAYKAQILADIEAAEAKSAALKAAHEAVLNKFRKLYAKDSGFPSLIKVKPEISNVLLWINENTLTTQELKDLYNLVSAQEVTARKLAKIETKKANVEEAYKAKILEVYGTSDRLEMLETMQLWTLMLTNPASFVDANKTDFKNKAAVTAYATAKVNAILDFQNWKIKKLDALNADIATINASTIDIEA